LKTWSNTREKRGNGGKTRSNCHKAGKKEEPVHRRVNEGGEGARGAVKKGRSWSGSS